MICINLIRVSADSKYLDINIETTGNCHLEKLVVSKLQYDRNGYNWYPEFDLSDKLNTVPKINPTTGEYEYEKNPDGTYVEDESGFYIPIQEVAKKQVLRIDLKAFGGSGFFKITMKEDCETTEVCDTIEAYASDVSSVYRYLIGKLMNMNCSCYKLDEDLERAFMFLYAHQEAMQLNRIDEAIKFYIALAKQFNLCGPDGRFGNNCVCQTPQSKPFNIPKKTIPAGCGCRR
jgi:hypothetical protein